MSSEWHEVTLGEVCAFAAGSAFLKSQQGSLTGEFPFVKVSDLSLPGNERFLVGSNNWVSSDQVAQMKVKLVPPNSTVFAKIGEGLKSERLRLTSRPTAIDNNLMAAIPDLGRVAPDFLRYLLETIGLSSWAHGSALPYLRQSDLQGISVSIPPLAEQRRIAGVLGVMDDLIEINQRIIRSMEQLAAYLFAAAENRGVPTRLGDIASVVSGKFLAKADRGTGSVPVFGSNGQISTAPRALEAEPVVVIGRVGACGKVALTTGPAWISDNALVVKSKVGHSPLFLYHLVRSIDFLPLIQGTTQPMIRGGDVANQVIFVPPLQMVPGFVEEQHVAARMLQHEIDDLTRTRDELLPLLLSGRVSVREVAA